MNMDGLFNMLQRLFLRRMIGTGIRKGIDLAANAGRDPADMTPAERKAAKASGAQMNATARRARQAARITRRLGR